ncbi:MoxR family ATPase [Halosquirtibacter xylanolyticus]|uniref:AAA family ATPase n=1 Tax=Halosquirtibacter xylanolyticus TaxID=3374599 RepID=UPI003748226F|nr:MoxR family ATPase [Prolixibacteraceae bacterium]
MIRNQILDLKAQMSNSIIGQEKLIDRLIITILCNGNLLLEGLPGLAKTRAIKSMSKYIDADLSRIQFTPDLLPSDITGTEILNKSDNEITFTFEKGPIFSNLVLADEINRAPAKVQSALLEAMQEKQISVGSTTHNLPKLFMVLATQNPIEQEGTYPLPEAQMDRFLMHVTVQYTDKDAEKEILRLVRNEELKDGKYEDDCKRVIPQEAIFKAREEIGNIKVNDIVEQYIVDIIDATRYPEKYDPEMKGWIEAGASPRGTIALDKASRAVAWLQGRDYVTPEDVKEIALDVLRHRIMLSYEATVKNINIDHVVDQLLLNVAVI